MPLTVTWQADRGRHNWHIAPAGLDGRVALYHCEAGAGRPLYTQPPLGAFLSIAEASLAADMLDEAEAWQRAITQTEPLRVSTHYGDLTLCSGTASTSLMLETEANARSELAKLAHAPPCTIASVAMHALRPLALLRSIRVDASPCEPLSQAEIAAIRRC